MRKWAVASLAGSALGIFAGITPEDAVYAMARSQGFTREGYADLLKQRGLKPTDGLVVTPLPRGKRKGEGR